MFGLGMPEILLILAIALIVIGPQKLPDLAKTLGRAMGEFKRSAQDFKRSIDIETTVKDIKDVDAPKADLKDILKETQEESARKTADSGTPESPADKETATENPGAEETASEDPDKKKTDPQKPS